ncbi:MAG: alpha/beta hydrolase [Xanthobacteraceae bacterium]|nr:alpha/beta hydrolase [Xanthobacteraceae bacterium]
MADLADLFPGFASHWIDTSVGKIFARSGGSGPPLLCLHGYPQTNVMWHQVAPELARHFTLIIPDLPGYGWSAVPDAKPDHAPYTKRAMAAVMIEVMETLGHVHFNLAGHDRGGRVAYRLALDHPERLNRLATLDIVPTVVMWDAMNAKLAMRAWHWTFLAQPAPLPELLLGKAANEYFDLLTEKWLAGNANAFDAHAIAHYRASFTDPLRIHASCEDYRAGQSTDVAFDQADRDAGRKITVPMLALWGANGLPRDLDPLAVWRQWATNVRGTAIDCGHFLCEEAPAATAKALVEFFTT